MTAAALATGDPSWNRSARFWAGIFAVNFVMGVVTGIPMEGACRGAAAVLPRLWP